MNPVVVHVVVRIEVLGLDATAKEFATECVESALEASDEVQRCFPDARVISSYVVRDID